MFCGRIAVPISKSTRGFRTSADSCISFGFAPKVPFCPEIRGGHGWARRTKVARDEWNMPSIKWYHDHMMSTEESGKTDGAARGE